MSKVVQLGKKAAKKVLRGVRPGNIKSVIDSRVKYDGAIVTLTVYNNYGNIIQRYALQQFLLRNGYRFSMLDLHDGGVHKNYHELKRFVERYLIQEKFHPRLSGYHKRYIVGSDQVWRHFSINKTWARFGIQFLNFVKSDKAKRIAYAASFGVDTLEEAEINDWHQKMIKPQLKKFDAISVREKSGRGLVKKLGGAKAAQVLDPTMLLKASNYNELINSSDAVHADTPSIFYYLITPTVLTDSALEYYEDELNAKSGGVLPYADLKTSEPAPSMEYWLKSIRDADMVVTDSYHALVFSIIFHTDFVVFDKSLGGIARISELLEPLGLSDRIVIQGNKKKYKVDYKPIDWAKVDKALDKKRKESADWLLGALDGQSN